MTNEAQRSEELSASAGSAFVSESQRVQWWLGKLDRYDNVKELTDGAHSEAAGAHEAMHLFKRLGLADADTKYAVIRCEVFEPVPDGSRANQDALKTLNGIGLGQNTKFRDAGGQSTALRTDDQPHSL